MWYTDLSWSWCDTIFFLFFFFGIQEAGMIKTLVFIIQTREKILWIFITTLVNRDEYRVLTVVKWRNQRFLFGRLECLFMVTRLFPIFHFFFTVSFSLYALHVQGVSKMRCEKIFVFKLLTQETVARHIQRYWTRSINLCDCVFCY